MAIHIGRREFVATLGATAAAWPLAARAHQAMPVIGYLSIGSQKQDDYLVTPFLQGLQEAGFVAGGNVAIEYRWAENQIDRLPGLAVMTDGRRKLLAALGGAAAAWPIAARAQQQGGALYAAIRCKSSMIFRRPA